MVLLVCIVLLILFYFFFFFFQAEDGIRDLTVTGVQTCALPILAVQFGQQLGCRGGARPAAGDDFFIAETLPVEFLIPVRSEERRVGKSVDLGGRRIIKKKKKIG